MNPSPTFAFLLLAVLLAGVAGAFIVWGFFGVAMTFGPLIALVMVVRYFMRLGSQPTR